MIEKLDHILRLADQAANRINDWIEANEKIFLTSHLDADGLSAAGILGSALHRRDANFQLRIVRQLDRAYLSTLAAEGSGHFIFSDFGSGQLPHIKETLAGAQSVIIDHHPPAGNKVPGNIQQINPHLCGIDGTSEISGAGVAYLVARHLGGSNEDLAALAVVGALGDLQDCGDKHSLISLNNDIIVEDAKAAEILDVSIDIRIFGRVTRPIHIALQYSTSPFIPGISNSPEGALAFLSEIEIELKDGDNWRSISSLTKEEKRRLNSSLITYMLKHNIPAREAQSLIGYVYTLKQEGSDSYTRDARMFATLLNACGRSDNGGIGVAICMGDRADLYQRAENILKEHRRQIAEGLSWLSGDPDAVQARRLIQAFHAEDKISETLVGSVAGLALNSQILDWSKPVFAFAYTSDGRVKVSARTTYKIVEAGAHLGKLLQKACEEIGSGSEGGGHNIAAGATIPRGSERRLLDIVERLLAKQLGKMKEAADTEEV
ncbi:MAG: DHHA1 domain-containing protein [Promethearchaeota archaeon]